MSVVFTLASRYRLDDELPWLLGIDPIRQYWLLINGSPEMRVGVPGLFTADLEEFKQVIRQFRELAPGDALVLPTASGLSQLLCLAPNCYAIPSEIDNSPVWHLFDRETLESLLMTAHPDWQCRPEDTALGRHALSKLGSNLLRFNPQKPHWDAR
ncbi:MAG: hypothetical protein HC890_10310 [Chloroflexaceae bacterium]|nr:hypothetical protein [Chloroflexaceae bacterium]